jgi:ParB family transcriptional regulator, chromosome partitioning protein
MSTKKRFSIAPDLANGLRNTIKSASTNQGQLHYDLMSLDVIEPDPHNPRKLSLSRHEILNGISSDDPDYANKQIRREALLELSESIKKIGIKNAIEVYKDGVIYRIITGERRYWAAILAEQKSVPVRISQKPDEFNLRYTQWVENINRQDLSLWEKFNNLNLIHEAYKKSNQGSFTEEILQKLLGVSSIQAYRYFCLLKADEKIIQLIQASKINNLKLIQELVSMKDKSARNQIVSWILQSKDEVTSLAHYRESAGKKVRNLGSQQSKSISLGKVNNIDVAKYLLEILLSDNRLEKYRNKYKHTDWTSTKSITTAFKDLFKLVEKEFSTKETN